MENEGAQFSADFGTLLRRYRLAAGLSQEALAERAGMSAHGVSALERGYRRTPQFETLSLLAGALALGGEQRREFVAAGSAASQRRGSVTVGPWSDAGTPNLPVALTTFIGRESELQDVAALAREHRIITLTGAGGVGKTRTASHLATTVRNAENETICFVALAPVEDSTLVVGAIASALGLQEVPERPLLETLVAYLKNKSLLLILDNCEHVIAEVARVTEALLDGCPRLRILATSRERLRSSGEHAYPLQGLTEADALRLFADRARAVDHRFTANGENETVILEICRRLDRMPLAIELAAARVNVLSLDALLTRLDDRLGVLSGGQRTASPRLQAMRAAIDWSYELLSHKEQRVFERLCVFTGGSTLEAAEHVCSGDDVPADDMLEVITSLVDKSLVVPDVTATEPRYRLLESFRQYGRDKLRSRGEEELTLRRHAEACVEIAKAVEAEYFRVPGSQFHEKAKEESPNLRAALRWALIERNAPHLAQLILVEMPMGSAVGSTYLEERQWVRDAIALVDEQTPTRVLAELRRTEATYAWHLCEYGEAIATMEIALDLHRRTGDGLAIMQCLDIAGRSLASLGQTERAKAYIEEALAWARATDYRRGTGWSLRCLAWANACAGDFSTARALISEAIPIYRTHFDRLNLASALNELAQYELCSNCPELALEHATEAASAERENDLGRRPETKSWATILNDMPIYLAANGHFEEAAATAAKAMEAASEFQLDILATCAMQSLAAITVLRRHTSRETRMRAARITGFVAQRFATRGAAPDLALKYFINRLTLVLSEALDDNTFEDVTSEGRAMTEERALEELRLLN